MLGRLLPTHQSSLRLSRAIRIEDVLVMVGDEARAEDEAIKAKAAAYYQRPEVKERKRAYYQRPEVKQRKRALQRAYSQRQRHARAFVPCPGPRCMTKVRGGGLCSFCLVGLKAAS